jgi:flagellar protein FlbB
MQKQPKTEQETTPEEQSGGILLWLLLGVLLVMLIGGGTALATYLGLVTPGDIANKARQIPAVVMKYIAPKDTTKSTQPIEEESELQTQPGAQTQPAQGLTPAAPAQSGSKQEPNLQPGKLEAAGNKTAAAKPPSPEEAKNISRLARLYANMKPEEAAPILKELDDDLIVSILRKMEDEQAAKILAALDAERAANLTRLYAGQKPVPAAPVTPAPATSPGSAKYNGAFR